VVAILFFLHNFQEEEERMRERRIKTEGEVVRNERKKK
jgi:hypothetical protein